ncbi:protein outspread isoform X1 [Labrus bergylta]|uniref:protein outspread isoform X1 n=1 Tax=Labrus bergylta TaxID=56723 RepID=UPI003313E8D1
MSADRATSPCNKFQANIFNKSKCQNCFKPRELHLLNDHDKEQVKPVYGGWLCLAPEGTDFENPVQRSRKWQRRFFILYEDGSLSFALDELPSTLPQGTMNLNLCSEVSDAETKTGQRNALCITTPQQEVFIRGDTKEIINGWSDQLAVFLRINKQNQKKKRKVEPVTSQEPSPAKMAAKDQSFLILESPAESSSAGERSPSPGPACRESGLLCDHVHSLDLLSSRNTGAVKDDMSNNIKTNNKSQDKSHGDFSERLLGFDELEEGSAVPRKSRKESRTSKREKLQSCGDINQLCAPPPQRRTRSLDRRTTDTVMTPDLLNFKKGWMAKLDENEQPKKYWFVLSMNSLRFYRDSLAEESSDLEGEIKLTKCFKVSEFHVQRNYGFQIHTPDGVFTLSTMTAGMRRSWIQALMRNLHPANTPDVTSLPGLQVSSEHLLRPDLTHDSSSAEKDEIKHVCVTQRRREGRYRTFDWVGFRSQDSNPETKACQDTQSKPGQEPDPQRTEAGSSEERRRSREERRRRYESVLGFTLSPESQQKTEEEVEECWRKVETSFFRSENSVAVFSESRDSEEQLEQFRTMVEDLKAQLEESERLRLKLEDELRAGINRQLEPPLSSDAETLRESSERSQQQNVIRQEHPPLTPRILLHDSEGNLRELLHTDPAPSTSSAPSSSPSSPGEGHTAETLLDVKTTNLQTDPHGFCEQLQNKQYGSSIPDQPAGTDDTSLYACVEHHIPPDPEVLRRLTQEAQLLLSQKEALNQRNQELLNQLTEADCEIERLRAELSRKLTQTRHLPDEEPHILPADEPHHLPDEEPHILPADEPHHLPDEEPCLLPAYEPHHLPDEEHCLLPVYEPHHLPDEEPCLLPAYEPHHLPDEESQHLPDEEPCLLPADERHNLPDEEPQLIPSDEQHHLLDEEERQGGSWVVDLQLELSLKSQELLEAQSLISSLEESLRETRELLQLNHAAEEGEDLKEDGKEEERHYPQSLDESELTEFKMQLNQTEQTCEEADELLSVAGAELDIRGQSHTDEESSRVLGPDEKKIQRVMSGMMMRMMALDRFLEVIDEVDVSCSEEGEELTMKSQLKMEEAFWSSVIKKLESDHSDLQEQKPEGKLFREVTEQLMVEKQMLLLGLGLIHETGACSKEDRDAFTRLDLIWRKTESRRSEKKHLRDVMRMKITLLNLIAASISSSLSSSVSSSTLDGLRLVANRHSNSYLSDSFWFGLILSAASEALSCCFLNLQCKFEGKLKENKNTLMTSSFLCTSCVELMKENRELRAQLSNREEEESSSLRELSDSGCQTAETPTQDSGSELQAQYDSVSEENVHQTAEEEGFDLVSPSCDKDGERVVQETEREKSTQTDPSSETDEVLLLRERVKELEEQLSIMQEMRQRFDGKLNSVQMQHEREMERLKANFKLGFASMEESHLKEVEELQRQHQQEVERLLMERDVLLEEESAATATAIEAIKNAHRVELQREEQKRRQCESSSGNTQLEDIYRRHREELASSHRELQVLSQQFSLRCLEVGHLVQALEAERKALSVCQQENQHLRTRNQELSAHLAAEINRLCSQVKQDNLPVSQRMEEYEMEITLIVKESEVQSLKQETTSLKDELQAAQRDKRNATKKYKEMFTQLSVLRAKTDRETNELRENLRLAHRALDQTTS